MKQPRSLAIVLALSFLLAGCVGDGDPVETQSEDAETAAPAAPTEQTGSIRGKIVSDSLEEVEGVAILVLGGDEVAHDTKTDERGMYTINGVEPATYIVQFTRVGFKDHAERVTVEADTVNEVNVQLVELTIKDLGEPYEVSDQYTGLLSCGVAFNDGDLMPDEVPSAVPRGLAWSTCSTGTSAAGQTVEADPNDKFSHRFTVEGGIKEIVVGMTWTPVGGASGQELAINMEGAGCGLNCASDYGRAAGPPDLLLSVKDTDEHMNGTSWGFENITEERTLQYRVFPNNMLPPNVIYQQRYTVYWTAFYNGYAPEAYNPIPEE